MVTMAGMEEHERKVVVEFCHLLEKSRQLFNGLRDLPPYGQSQWQGYFGRTFDIYTKLWKFQQQHRHILDHKYGLKRWQIGEIASKIGQLYYHYYLRTSETNYLNEAYSFYSAIRGRAYYSRAAKEDRSDLMVKKLRYYARFIVVCLLLKKMNLVRELVVELEKQIIDYTSTYEPEDQLEWTVVLDEIKSFIKAENQISILDNDSNLVVVSHRLNSLNAPQVEKSLAMNLRLQEVVIVGHCANQVKFSELTMDMFRMLQTLEREPQEDFSHIYDPTLGLGRLSVERPHSTSKGISYPHLLSHENGERTPRRENSHKYLLYRPTVSQLLVFLAAGCQELPATGAILLYISADGSFSQSKQQQQDVGYDTGGVVMDGKKDLLDHHNRKPSQYKEIQCLYPGDLYPYTRKPLFFIIDSDNSFVFQHLPRFFGEPLVILMSPPDIPQAYNDGQRNGSLFTLFLHSPLTAFCVICKVLDIPLHLWDKCQIQIDRFLSEASRLFTRCRIDNCYVQFFGDDFLRLLILRYVFCHNVLYMHKAFQGRQFRPRALPALPDSEFLDHPSLQRLVCEIATNLEVREQFCDEEVD